MIQLKQHSQQINYQDLLSLVKQHQLQQFVSFQIQTYTQLKPIPNTNSFFQIQHLINHKAKGSLEHKTQIHALNQTIKSRFPQKQYFFQLNFTKGQKFPTLQNLKKINQQQQQQICLIHQPNTLLIVFFWSKYSNQSFRVLIQAGRMVKLLRTEDIKVRLVAICQQVRPIHLQYRIQAFGQIQFLMQENNLMYDRINGISIGELPYSLIINKEGIIDYAGDLRLLNLQQRLYNLNKQQYNKIIKQQNILMKKVVQHQQNNKKYELNLQNYNKIIKTLQGLKNKQIELNLQNFNIHITKLQSFYHSQLLIKSTKLNIQYVCTKKQQHIYQSFLQNIYSQLSSNQYQIRAFIYQQHQILQSCYQLVNHILQTCNINKKAIIQQRYEFNGQWQKQQSILFQPMYIGIDITNDKLQRLVQQIDKYEKILSKFKEYFKINKNYLGDYLQRVNGKFAGLNNLRNIRNGDNNNNISIEYTDEFRFLIIWRKKKNEISYNIKHILTLMTKYNIKGYLISEGYMRTQDIKYFEQQNIQLYECQSNKQLQIYTKYNKKYIQNILLIINKQGIILDFINLDNKLQQIQILNIINHIKQQNVIKKQYEEEKKQFIISLINNKKQIQNIYKNVKHANFSNYMHISFNILYQPKILPKMYSQLYTKIQISDRHKILLEYYIQKLKLFGQIQQNYVQTFDIPQHSICSSCLNQLLIPFYYFYWSKIYQCYQCATKQINSYSKIPLIQLYTLNQNAILCFGQTNVDVITLGKNLQPKTNQQCRSHSFICDGCGRNSPHHNARFICLGCRRQPNKQYDHIDFCFDCTHKFSTGDQDQIIKIVEKNKQRGHYHTLTHSLLRVNWGNGYKNY